MKNMGLCKLILVEGNSPLHPDAYKLASGAEDILERAGEFPTLREAISDMGCVVGTTSRTGRGRIPLLTPREMIRKLAPISEMNSVGIVFGSEKEGLTNQELGLCHLYVRIPSSATFPSLNLAQAVMVISYELFQTRETISKPAVAMASSEQRERMFDHMEKTLLSIGFLETRNSKRMMKTFRRLFGESPMEERDVRILQGIWSKVDWVVRKSRGDR